MWGCSNEKRRFHFPRHRGAVPGTRHGDRGTTARAEIAVGGASLLSAATQACRFSSTACSLPSGRAATSRAADYNGLVKKYCVGCHNDRNKDRAGSLSLASFDIAKAGEDADVAERMIRKLQAGMMPPPGMPRPDPAVYQGFIRALESDGRRARGGESESRRPHVPAPESRRVRARDPGAARPRRRRRRVAAARHDERELRQHRRRAGAVADAARVVSERGGRHQPHGGRRSNAPAIDHTYTNPSYVSQHPWDHVEGAPYGTRGGMVVDHVFPADGEYAFEVTFNARRQRALRGRRHLDRRRARRAARVRERASSAAPTAAARRRCRPSRSSSRPASTRSRPRSSGASTARTKI